MAPVWKRVLRRASGQDKLKPINLSYGAIPGLISGRALDEHYKLYTGYIDTLNRVDENIRACPIPEKHQADHPYRLLKEAESFAIGGVLLHELYFQNLTTTPSHALIYLDIEEAISNKWGSMESWWREMRATALMARGWAVLGACEIDPTDLRVFMLDSHNVGAMFGYSPIAVIDCFEHSYWMDHGTDRETYLDRTFKALDILEINKRYIEIMNAATARK
jgi:Fe-Mn family superoxide dismutase